MIFSAIFMMLHEQSEFSEQFYLSDLITSFAAYARLRSHLPDSNLHEIPWQKIGISSTFFNQKIIELKYTPNNEYTNKQLLSVDCLHWILDKILFSVRCGDIAHKPKYNIPEQKNICMLSDLAFTLSDKNWIISITKDDLIISMFFDPKHHTINYKTKDKNLSNQMTYFSYPNSRSKVIGFFM